MKIKNNILRAVLLSAMLTVSLASCNKWLDVRSETEAKEEELFSKKNGFCNALTGIYINLAETNAYGQALTMTKIEQLAHNWYNTSSDYFVDYYYLCRHEYENTECKSSVESIYSTLYNIIAKANVLIKNIEENPAPLVSHPQLKGCIEGEAHALKALCQFDVLRLFGQLPNGLGTRSVRLPYSFTTAITEIPKYYDYDEYVKLLFTDINKAIELLEKNDPVLQYTLSALSIPSTLPGDFPDSYLHYRRVRMNYWAARALRARMNLYLGNTEAAHREALEIINAKTTEGSPICTLNAQFDLDKGYFTLPSEGLFSLSKYNVFSYTNNTLFGFSSGLVTPNNHLVYSQAMFNDLFKGVNTASHNRYSMLWNRKSQTSTDEIYPALAKYYYDTSKGTASSIYQTLIPMIRLSEMYLIAMETTEDLTEANTLYNTYMRDHNILLEEPAFKSLAEVRNEVVNEYRREFLAEGHMFYTYKRLFMKNIMWQVETMNESDYIIPLPDREYEKE